jgi:hypothetical protein
MKGRLHLLIDIVSLFIVFIIVVSCPPDDLTVAIDSHMGKGRGLGFCPLFWEIRVPGQRLRSHIRPEWRVCCGMPLTLAHQDTVMNGSVFSAKYRNETSSDNTACILAYSPDTKRYSNPGVLWIQREKPQVCPDVWEILLKRDIIFVLQIVVLLCFTGVGQGKADQRIWRHTSISTQA